MVSIIGRGEIGRVFERCARARGLAPTIVRRGDDLMARTRGSDPIVVCVREDDLRDLVPKLREDAARTVFVQNGFIEPLLADFGETTRGLLWFTAKGPFFRVLAPSVFFGPRAQDMVALLEAEKIAASVASDRRAFLSEMTVKLAWNNVVGLPLSVRSLPLAEYLARHGDEARAIVDETCSALSLEFGLAIDSEGAFQRLIETTRDLGHATGGRKALEFRNRAVVDIARRHGRDAPINAALLASAP